MPDPVQIRLLTPLDASAYRALRLRGLREHPEAFTSSYEEDAQQPPDAAATRVAARSNKLLGQWAAAKMGLTAEETDAYAKSVVQADFEEAGHEDVIRKVLGDLTGAGVEIDEAGVRAALEEKSVEARRQLMGGV